MAHEEEWFNDNPFDPGEVHLQTLLDAEVAPTGDRLAVVRGDNQETIRFLEMSGPPPDPSTPVTGCWFANPSGKFVSWCPSLVQVRPSPRREARPPRPSAR